MNVSETIIGPAHEDGETVMTTPGKTFQSIVLAGERSGGSALAREFSTSAGVMVPVAGVPSLQRVLQILEASHLAGGGIVCGPAAEVVASDDTLRTILDTPSHQWLEPASGPAASALAAVNELDHFPVLLTAGDHALLTPEIVDDFCLRAQEQRGADIVIGFVPYALVRAAWPESRRTVLKFSDGGYCGANLFAILSPKGCEALRFWQRLESLRKQPWKIAGQLGFKALFLYLFKRLALEDALATLSDACGCRIGHVLLDNPRAAVDVDTAADQRLAEKILSVE